jgi:hypothetical protein
MKTCSSLLKLSGLLLLALHYSEDPAKGDQVPLAFVKAHCSDCHHGSDAEGGFRAEALSDQLSDPTSHRIWSRVLARVQSREMPPPQNTDRPPDAEIKTALTALKKALHAEAIARHGESGRVRVRRLNRLEYENTVRDLLDIDTPLRDLLPEDDHRDGFANQADGLSISPVHIQQYMAAADRSDRAADRELATARTPPALW